MRGRFDRGAIVIVLYARSTFSKPLAQSAQLEYALFGIIMWSCVRVQNGTPIHRSVSYCHSDSEENWRNSKAIEHR